MKGGPRIFVERLGKLAVLPEGVVLANPSLEEVRTARRAKSQCIVARLDNTSYYKICGRNLQGLLTQRKPRLAKLLAPLVGGDWESILLTARVNRYLDRAALWLLRNAHGLVFQSELSRAMHMRFLGYVPGRVPEAVILNGVDLAEFSPKKGRRLEGSPAVIVSASSYRLHKRLQDCVGLVNLLARQYPRIKLHVLGEPDVLVAPLLKGLDLNRCVFRGRVSPQALSEFYGGADVQLSLCIFDACPNVVVEGLASGLPVLTPLESGAAELIGRDNRDWAVQEHLPLDYYALQAADLVPRAPLNEYADAFVRIVDDLDAARDRARARAESALDINVVARRYREFMESCLVRSRESANAG